MRGGKHKSTASGCGITKPERGRQPGDNRDLARLESRQGSWDSRNRQQAAAPREQHNTLQLGSLSRGHHIVCRHFTGCYIAIAHRCDN